MLQPLLRKPDTYAFASARSYSLPSRPVQRGQQRSQVTPRWVDSTAHPVDCRLLQSLSNRHSIHAAPVPKSFLTAPACALPSRQTGGKFIHNDVWQSDITWFHNFETKSACVNGARSQLNLKDPVSLLKGFCRTKTVPRRRRETQTAKYCSCYRLHSKRAWNYNIMVLL